MLLCSPQHLQSQEKNISDGPSVSTAEPVARQEDEGQQERSSEHVAGPRTGAHTRRPNVRVRGPEWCASVLESTSGPSSEPM